MDRGGPTGNTPSKLHLLWEDGLLLCLRMLVAFQKGPGRLQSVRLVEQRGTEA